MSPEPVFRISDQAVSEFLDGEAVVLNLRTGEYFKLNRTGARLWQLIEQQADVRRIRKILEDEYDVDPVGLREDVDRILGKLLTEGLLVRVDAAEGER